MGSFSFNVPLFRKYFFYTFNFYLLLCGLCILIWSLALYLEVQNLYRVVPSWKRDAVLLLELLMAINSILIVFAFCGGLFSILFFDNAKFRNELTCNISCNITTCNITIIMFAVLFLLILIVQSTAAIYFLVVPGDERVNFKKAINNYIVRSEDREYVDYIQNRFHCCGFYSYIDYIHMGIPIPDSCCNWRSGCTVDDVSSRYGCEYEINNWFKFVVKIYIISIFVLIFTAVELIGMIVALCLVNSIKKEHYRMQRNINRHAITSHGNNFNKIFPASS